VKVTVLYVGSSLLAPLKRAEPEINREYSLGLQIAAHNCGAPFSVDDWQAVEEDILTARLLFIIHVTDDENAARISAAVKRASGAISAVIAFNCMPELMRLTRMGRLDFSRLGRAAGRDPRETGKEASSRNLIRKLFSWMAESARGREKKKDHNKYLRLIGKMPAILKYVPGAGRLKDIKNYLYLFCYFLQPTPNNIRSMILHAIKHYVPEKGEGIKVAEPETMPVVGIYHPDAPSLFESFDAYKRWYERGGARKLEGGKAVGLLLMRPQIISDARRHYDGLIRAIEDEGLQVVPAISTFMDNRDAVRQFFIEAGSENGASDRNRGPEGASRPEPRVSQIVSLTGFSFVGGPAMNDNHAAVEFLRELDLPFRSLVSLDFQSIDNWEQNRVGLNPIQAAMQVAIPEIDGATEAFIFGGMPRNGEQPEPIEDRCRRIARRLARWNRVATAARSDLRLALITFCFPPNKGNIGTAADLDVFSSLHEILTRLRAEGYSVELPEGPEALRELVLGGNSAELGTLANVAYRMTVEQYRELCPYVGDIEREWGPAPGTINSDGRELLIHGVELGSVFIGVQPTFGYEGDPMRMLSAESASPHHGFMALYTYLEKVFSADAIIHVGTHGSLEFMPGKQAGLSSKCWPDRLISELPNIYLYSVNNPAEGTIAKRRSYAELVSYLTPPIENAGLYKDLVSMKDLLSAYRQARSEPELEQLFEAIEEKARGLNL
jgi:magnesium chelatase subunit H